MKWKIITLFVKRDRLGLFILTENWYILLITIGVWFHVKNMQMIDMIVVLVLISSCWHFRK